MIKIPKYERIIMLGREKAIDAIKDADTVMYRHGVWNEYYKTKTENAIKSIENSGYGADVYRDGNGILYVSVPCERDMW